MKINIIASISNNNVIGHKGDMPWKQKSDLKRFKEITEEHIVIMGRKTYESIGGRLSGRINIIITKNASFNAFGCYIVSSVKESINLSQKLIDDGIFEISDDVFVIGGGEIYKEFMPMADKLYITRLNCDIENGDTYFPEIDKKYWKLISKVSYKKDDKNDYDYSYEYYDEA